MPQHFFRFAFFALAFCSLSLPARAELIEYIVALVDDSVILSSEFEQFKRIQRFEEQHQERSDDELLDSMILRRIQLNRAERYGIRISDDQFNRRLGELAQQNSQTTSEFLTRLADFPGGVRGWRDFMYNNMLLEQFQRRELQNQINVSEEDARNFLLTETGQGLSNLLYQVAFISLPVSSITGETTSLEKDSQAEEELERMALFLEGEGDFATLAREITSEHPEAQIRHLEPSRLSRLPSVFSNRIPLMRTGNVVALKREHTIYLVKLLGVTSEQPVLREEVRARHILLQPSILRSREQTMIELASLRERILAGERFGSLARVFSEDPGSAKAGGTLGWMPYDQLDPAFAGAAKKLPLNTLSELVESSFGFHLIEVMERAKRDISETNELHRIRQYIFQQKLADELPRLLASLRQSAFIEIRHASPPKEKL